MNNEFPVKILLVEDDEDDFLIIRDYLPDTVKYEIVWANTYKLFLSYMNEQVFDLVITDYLLGSVSGFDVLKAVRDKDPFLPVILLTGKGNNSIDVEAMKLGASDYLIKGSFDTASIERSIRYALERSHSAKILQENEAYQNTIDRVMSTGRIATMLAHEVKNPLTNIMLCVGQLKEALSQNEDMISYIDIIDRNSHRINQLVSNLLDSTRFGDVAFQKQKLADVIRETLLLADDRIRLKAIKVTESYDDLEIELDLDKEKMKIALLNIIINAIEALEEKSGLIEIKVHTQKSGVSIHIKDNGIGIPKENIGNIFEPFFTSKQKGTGLGMPSTQSIIIGHKGKIEVKSELGKGTEFVISLPL